jgi:hypothetical protein
MKNGQPEVRAQAERPRVQYIGIKGQKISLEAAVPVEGPKKPPQCNDYSCTYQEKSGGTKLYLKGWSEEQDMRRGTWEEAKT